MWWRTVGQITERVGCADDRHYNHKISAAPEFFYSSPGKNDNTSYGDWPFMKQSFFDDRRSELPIVWWFL